MKALQADGARYGRGEISDKRAGVRIGFWRIPNLAKMADLARY